MRNKHILSSGMYMMHPPGCIFAGGRIPFPTQNGNVSAKYPCSDETCSVLEPHGKMLIIIL